MDSQKWMEAADSVPFVSEHKSGCECMESELIIFIRFRRHEIIKKVTNTYHIITYLIPTTTTNVLNLFIDCIGFFPGNPRERDAPVASTTSTSITVALLLWRKPPFNSRGIPCINLTNSRHR